MKRCLPVAITFLVCTSVFAQQNLCDIQSVGTLTPGELKPKFSATQIWQGAWGGVKTNDADRIIGLYDLI